MVLKPGVASLGEPPVAGKDSGGKCLVHVLALSPYGKAAIERNPGKGLRCGRLRHIAPLFAAVLHDFPDGGGGLSHAAEVHARQVLADDADRKHLSAGEDGDH